MVATSIFDYLFKLIKMKIQFLSWTSRILSAQYHMWLMATTLNSADTEHSMITESSLE